VTRAAAATSPSEAWPTLALAEDALGRIEDAGARGFGFRLVRRAIRAFGDPPLTYIHGCMYIFAASPRL
jgi:hypothetical protein